MNHESLWPEFATFDATSAAAVQQRANSVLRPTGALRRLDEVAEWLAGWQRTSEPHVAAPAAVVFVADHGVATEGVSAYPASVTQAMLEALDKGAATASVLAESLGVHLEVVDVGVGLPTGVLSIEPALDEARFERCFETGRRTVADLDCDLLILGEMGIGNTTAAAAIATALYGPSADVWTGSGTGVDGATLAHKVDVVGRAARRVVGLEPLEILREVGGSELVAIAGAIVEARTRSIPVLLDGFVVTAAAAPLEVAHPGALDHCWAGHVSDEAGHRALLAKLNKQPLLDLGLRLGEASGALFALPLVRLAAASVVEVATFDEWGLD